MEAEVCLYFPSLHFRRPFSGKPFQRLPAFIYNVDTLCIMEFLHYF